MDTVKQVEKLDHVHIYVKSVEKAKTFFSSLFGTSFSDTIVEENMKVRTVIDSLGLELIEAASQDSPVAKIIAKRGEGIAALSFKVSDLEAAIQELQNKGLRLVSRVKLGSLKEAQFHPKDSYGVMIELCEYDEKSQTALAALGRI